MTTRLIYIRLISNRSEGWGLCMSESMTCGIPNIQPDWSALAEWCRDEELGDCVHFVPCTSLSVNTGGLNTVGGVADQVLFVEALNKMYYDENYRHEMSRRAYKLMQKTKFQWDDVVKQFDYAIKSVLKTPSNNAG